MELLIVIAIIAVVAAVVFVAVDPAERLAASRNTRRWHDVQALTEAVNLYLVDNQQEALPGIDGGLRMLGTAAADCSVTCDPDAQVASFDLNNGRLAAGTGRPWLGAKLAQAAEVADSRPASDLNQPQILWAQSSPVKVVPGDTMTITVAVKDSLGVQEVSAAIGQIETVELNLVSGGRQDGLWQVDWLVHDTEIKNYSTIITVLNQSGLSSTIEIFWSDPEGTRWVLPTGYEDPGNQWTGEINAYDDNTGTYARNTYASVGYSQFIVFTLSEPLVSDRVRVNTDYLDAYVQQVDIDIYVDGAWVDVFLGGSEALWNSQWAEVPFEQATVTKARFRYNFRTSGLNFWLYEFQFYQAATEIIPPDCTTNNATLIRSNSAVLNGMIDDDGGENCDYRFQYGIIPYFNLETDWVSGKSSGESFNSSVSGLSGVTTYYFRAQARNSAGTVNCGNRQFTTTTEGPGWTLPGSYQDPDSGWSNEAYSYDDNNLSYARAYHAIYAAQWSPFVYLSHAAVASDKIRFYALGGQEVTQVDVDVYKDGQWEDVYQGSFADKQWVEKTFVEGSVTQARIRFYAAYSDHGFFWELYEFNFYRTGSDYVETTADACLDLSDYLVPKYLESLPLDPDLGDEERTYYAIKKESGGKRLTVVSCGAELQENIAVTK